MNLKLVSFVIAIAIVLGFMILSVGYILGQKDLLESEPKKGKKQFVFGRFRFPQETIEFIPHWNTKTHDPIYREAYDTALKNDWTLIEAYRWAEKKDPVRFGNMEDPYKTFQGAINRIEDKTGRKLRRGRKKGKK